MSALSTICFTDKWGRYTMDHQQLAAALLPYVHEAGRAIMVHYGQCSSIQKANGSPLSAADLAAERALQAGLANIAPDIPVISEEAEEEIAKAAGAGRFFLVDPLDGTKEFLNGHTDFTVNVALIEGGVPTFGIIYAPALATLYVTLARDRAAKAQLAPDEPIAGSLEGLELEPLGVRELTETANMVACVSRSHRGDRMDSFLARLDEPEGLSVGSSLKFCMVAEGRADVYPRLGPTKEWDTAAGQAIVEAAGGKVDVLGGERLRYGKTEDDYLNPEFIAYGPRFSPADTA